MARVLVTGMSGTGKSTALIELAARGIPTIDTDYGDWSLPMPDPVAGGQMQVWREDLMDRLLGPDGPGELVVAGTVSNQGRFYDRFASVVLLSAPVDVILERIRRRTTNPFGQDPAGIERILRDLEEVEPLLRAGCTVEVDATRAVSEIADEIEALARMSSRP